MAYKLQIIINSDDNQEDLLLTLKHVVKELKQGFERGWDGSTYSYRIYDSSVENFPS